MLTKKVKEKKEKRNVKQLLARSASHRIMEHSKSTQNLPLNHFNHHENWLSIQNYKFNYQSIVKANI